MRLAGRVADSEAEALAPWRPDAGQHRPDGQPSALAARAGEREAYAAAGRAKPGWHGVAGCDGRSGCAPLAQCVAAYAARERQQSAVRDDHAAVSASERQHRQQTGLQARAAEVRLERDEI